MAIVAVSVALVALGLATTVALLLIAATAGPTVPDPPPPLHPLHPLHPSPRRPAPGVGGRLRLSSRALFASRSVDAITLDCTLMRAEDDADEPPVGLPFTLQLRPPQAGWFASRVEELLAEWAADNRELLLELREDHGRVRTMIASGESSVYLELTSAAGLAAPGLRPDQS
jgi:hypothetical protein